MSGVRAIPIVAIAGGGFAGSMLAVQLARQSRIPLRIKLYDAAGRFARGVAYGTEDPNHLLNVRADRMGAFDDKPDDFYRWLLSNETELRRRHPGLAPLKIAPEAFMPRLLYGDYIAALLEEAVQSEGRVVIETIAAEITDAEKDGDGILLTFKDGNPQKADVLVLALGNLFSGKLSFEKDLSQNPRYIGSPWQAGTDVKLSALAGAAGPVVIVGTGLTMIDMLLTLRARSYQGKIIALSRHGLLPQPHGTVSHSYPVFLSPRNSPQSVYALTRSIRREIEHAQNQAQDWRGVIDSLRADTVALWGGLCERERKKSSRVLAFWNTHRHRMPPCSAEFLARERDRGLFEVCAGRVETLRPLANGLEIIVSKSGKKERLEAAYVINCAGPGTDILASGNKLLINLHAHRLIAKGPAGMGVAAQSNGRVIAGRQSAIFILGPLLVGERLETIAVPEIRGQAESVAGAILRALPEK